LRQPWVKKKQINAESIRRVRRITLFRVKPNMFTFTRVVACASNPGLELPNAFGVIDTFKSAF
jgi:hypothetical protein